MIVSRGAVVRDPDPLRRLDQAGAAALHCWEPMSLEKTIHAVDAGMRELRSGRSGLRD